MKKRKDTKSYPKIIAVDFDGTLCENKWPEIGAANLDLIEYLRTQQSQGSKLILWTCRSGSRLDDAITWCARNGLVFDAVNKNLMQSIERFGEDTRKIFADEYIDDLMCTKFKLPYKETKEQKMKSKKLKLVITEEDGQLRIDGENNGFNAMEIIGILEAKKQDILDQLNHPEKYKYTRTAVVDGEVIAVEEVETYD